MYKNHTPLNQTELKILELFLDLNKHYFAEISKKTKLTRPRTMRVLKKFTTLGILHAKIEANIKYYSLEKEPIVYSTLSIAEYNKTIKFLEKNKTIKRALKMFSSNYKDYLSMLIFGSHAKGYANKMSDIDLLLIKEKFSKRDIKKIEDLIEIINGRTGLKISPYLIKISEFNQNKAFTREIMENHIILEGGELYFKLVLK